jgi:hypothetical protein
VLGYVIKYYTPCPETASELYRPIGSRLSAKLVPTFSDRGCHVGSVMDTYGRILGFLESGYVIRMGRTELLRRWLNANQESEE